MNVLNLRLSLLGAALLLGAPALAQKTPARPSTPGGTAAPQGASAGVTWYRDVLPIIRERCQVCHEPEGVGAFPLQTHSQALEHLSEIGDAVRSGYMPPWQPADGCQTFRDARRLTKRETEVILAWVGQGGTAGVPWEAPPAGKPEAVTADVTLSAPPAASSSADSTRCHAVAWDSAKERDLTAYEVEPGGPGVQHVLLYTAPELDVKALEAKDAEPGWACSSDPGSLNAQLVGMWAPGTPALTRLPPGTGIRLSAGAPFVMQVHTTGGAGKASGPTVAKLQLAPKPVTRTALFMPVWKSGYSIPSRATGFTLSRTFQMPEDGVLLGVFPHMHGLGRRIKLEASNACVLDIPYWDTSAQQPYFFESLVGVPVRAGSRLTLSCTWNNPSTTRVRSGEAAGKEMCLAWLYLTR